MAASPKAGGGAAAGQGGLGTWVRDTAVETKAED